MKYKTLIEKNTIEINRLRKRINDSFNVKNQKDDWRQASIDFFEQYHKLCFWNGVYDYRNEIRNDNLEAIEYYICFIELRPYFFRSGYMYNDLMRVFKNINLTTDHKRRYNSIRARYLEFKKNQKQR